MANMLILLKYIKQIMSMAFNRCNDDKVFLTWHGIFVSRGQVTFKMPGLGTNITFTLFRNSVVTAMHEEHPGLKTKLADHMMQG